MQTPNDPADQAALEALLGKLAPATPELDRDAVMYRAGMAAARRSPVTRIWQFSTLLWVGISAIFAGQLWSSRHELGALREAVSAMARDVQELSDELSEARSAPPIETRPPLTDQRSAAAAVPKPVGAGPGRWSATPVWELESDMLPPYTVTAGSSLQQASAHWERMDRPSAAAPGSAEKKGQDAADKFEKVEHGLDPYFPNPPTLWQLNQELFSEAL